MGLLAIFTIAWAIVFVTCKNQKARQEYKEQSQTQCQPCPCATVVATLIQAKHGKSEAQKGTDSPPCWYVFLAWPEGATAWAIILTLGAITWQAIQTRKSAEASRDQVEISRKAFVSQFRPRVPVRAVRLTEQDGALKVEIWLTNIGDTPAHITKSDMKVGWEVPAELKKKIVASSTFPLASLQPGQDHPTTVDITEIAIPYRVAQIAVDEMGRDQEAWIYCFGNLTYLDDNGSSRSTGFFRKYDIKRKRFIPSDDPEEEYAD